MPTLDELLGKNYIDEVEKNNLEDFFSTDDINAGGIDYSDFDYTPGEIEELAPSDRNAALDFVGQSLWNLADTGLFGIPGLLVDDEFEESYLRPETTAGKVGAAIGGTVGFIKGAPIRLGTKIAQGLATPLIKKLGAPTVTGMTKKIVQEVSEKASKNMFTSKAAKQILKKDIGKNISYLNQKARWDQAGKKAAENWVTKASTAIDDLVKEQITVGSLTAKEGALLSKTFKKHATTRPMQDFVDIIMKRNPNKWGFVAGNAIQEAVAFGMIDAAMERTSSWNMDREYDYTAPLWGIATGSAFGALRLLPAAGKQSITSEDFMSGMKAVFRRNAYKNMSSEKLIKNANIIGKTKLLNENSSVINFKGMNIDLLNPISSIGKGTTEGTKILRAALSDQRRKYGTSMMKEAVKEDFKSSLANWKRVIGGTAIMNMRTMAEMYQGHDIPPEDIMTSMMIGAFINRKGRPLTPDMNMSKMREIRLNLNSLGVPQSRIFELTPTLGKSQFEFINPLTDRGFKDLRTKAEELKIIGSTPEEVETIIRNGKPTLAATEKSFPLFDEFYSWLSGASGKRYIKPKALITEAEAKEIEQSIRNTKFDGKRVNSLKELREVLTTSTEKITDNLEYEISKTTYDILSGSTNEIPNDPSGGSLGPIPESIIVKQSLVDKIDAGKIDDISSEVMLTNLRKAQNLLDTTVGIMKADKTQVPDNKTVIIDSVEKLRSLIDNVAAGESRINNMFGTGKKNLQFDFDNLEHLQFPLLARHMNKSVDKISKFFSDTDNDSWGDLLNELQAAGIVKKSTTEPNKFDLLNFKNIEIVKEEGFKGTNEESLVKSLIGILAAKGNKSINVDNYSKSTITPEQIQRLDQFLTSNKIATQRELLDMFRTDITQKIFSNVVKTTNLEGRDIAILNDLAGLDIPLARYSTLADGGTGFGISKVMVAGLDGRTKAGKAAARYNEYVDSIVKRGTSEDGKEIVASDRELELRDPNDIIVLDNIVRRKGTKEQQNAAETLVDFVKGMDPKDSIRNGLISLLHKMDNPDDMMNFMLGKGLIAPEKKKNTIKYEMNVEAFNQDDIRYEITQWLKRFGVHTDDIQKLQTSAEIEIDNFIDAKYKEHKGGNLSQQGFFDEYFPADSGFGSKYQEAETQNKILTKALYDSKGNLHSNPHDNLILDMNVKIGDDIIAGKDIIKGKGTKYREKYEEIFDDVQKLVVLRNGTISKPVLHVSKGEVREKMKNMQKGPLTDFLDDNEIPFVFVDGEMISANYQDKNFMFKSVNVFDMESPHNAEGPQKNAATLAKKQRDAFYNALNKYEMPDVDNSQGIAVIRMGNAKNPIAMSQDSYNKVTELFKKNIFNKYKNKATGTAKDRIDNMMEILENSQSWSVAHEDAMRSMIIQRMVTSKGEDRFLNIMDGSSSDMANIGKRFSLYHTPSFKRIDRNIVKTLAQNVKTMSDMNLIKSYEKRKIGYVTWDDKGFAGIKDRVEGKLKKARTSWEKMLGSRSDESGFDSISFISKDFKRFLELYYGVSKRGSNVFKPIISSQGENDDLMFAKTVFVYDPDIQADFFGKNKRMDIMVTGTADKMKSSMSENDWISKGKPDRPVRIEKTPEEMLKITPGEISRHLRTLSMKSIGVSVIPENEMLARQSYSIPNYMNSSESAEYYDTYYKDRMDKVLGSTTLGDGIMSKLMKDTLYRRTALLKLKNLNPNVTLEDMQTSQEGLENLGKHLQWAALGGDPSAMGDNVMINTIKSQFLDPLFSPGSKTDKDQAYGAKAVLKQSFKFRDLDPTIRTGEGDKTKIKNGEIMLPAYAAEGAIKFDDPNMVLKAVDKKGNVKDIESVIKDLWKKDDPNISEKDLDDLWIYVQEGGLGSLHGELKRLDPDWSVGINATRYPRTAPNDLAILRLKGFLEKDHGNTAIANDFDVLNIFEGDYDVDEIDFFWGMNKKTWDHVDRVKGHWVNTVNTDHYQPKLPELSIMNNGATNNNWNTFDSNNRVFKRGIGMVQKTVRLVNHLAELGVKNKDGKKDLMEYTTGGEKFRISVDYDNASFFERTALESQMIIDYWSGVPTDIVNKMVGWRNDYLFPRIDKSVAKEDIPSFEKRQHDLTSKGPENNRIRLFRKFKANGDEVELSEVDKTVIRSMMREHSKLLSLGTEVFDGSGQSRPPTYDDIMDVGRQYFNGHLKNMTNSIFMAVRRKHGGTQEVRDIFDTDHKVRTEYAKKLGFLKGDDFQRLESNIKMERSQKKDFGIYTYSWWNKSPLLDGVLANAQETARSMGQHGSVVERIYREILHRDPLSNDNKDGRADIVLQGSLFNEMETAASFILNKDISFGNNPTERMKSILPKFTKDVNQDVKIIKYYKKLIGSILRNNELPQKTKTKRVEALSNIIKEKEALLVDILPKQYLDSGQSKYLKSLKMVDITRDKAVEEGTIQWYSLYEMSERYRPEGNIAGFYDDVTKARKLGAELYSEHSALGETAEYRNMQMVRDENVIKRMKPTHEIADVEQKLWDVLDKGFDDHGFSFLFEYAMPSTDQTVIGMYNGNPMPVSSKPSGRYKRVLRYLFDKHNTETDRVQKLAYKEVLENLATRHTAYKNFFEGNYGLIPMQDQDVMGILNNVPGFGSKLTGTFDRYQSLNVEKGYFSKDAFGMGPEYDSHVSFYRRLIGDAFGDKSKTAMDYKELNEVLSYTNQLAMENNYMDPMSYYQMTENVRNKLVELGLDKASQFGVSDGYERVNPHSMSPDLAAIGGKGNGVSIKPMALLSNYRLNMLKKFLKQGKEIKINQKRASNMEEEYKNDVKAGYCDGIYD